MNQQMEKSKSNGGAVEIVMNAFSEYKNSNDKNLEQRDNALNSKIEDVQQQTDRIEELLNRPFTLDSVNSAIHGNKKASRYAVIADGRKLPILARDESYAAHHPANNNEDYFSVGDFVKASMGIPSRQNSALTTGSATVATSLASQIIDAVRAKTTLIRAGAMTLPITEKTVLSRIDADPVVYSHVQATADISTSVPTFTPITLEPSMLVAQVPLSVELVADSINLDELLKTSLAAAFASKLDSVGISQLLTSSDIEESASAHDPALWLGLTAAVGAHLALNADTPKAVICNATEYNSRNSSTLASGEWINRPTYLEGMLDLHSTGMTAGKMLLGDFSKSLLLAVRQDLRLELIRWNGTSDATHLLIAYLRGQFYLTQPKLLFRGLKTVV